MQKRLARASLATLLVLVHGTARARENPGLHETGGESPRSDDDNAALEEEALGPRGNLRTRAETVSFDARERTLELSGDVRVDVAPFHLRSQHIKLSRTRYGIEIDGKGKLAFCPCLGTPVTVSFEKTIVAPPGDLILKEPTLQFYGVPILHLPWFWLRSDEKFGVLPPDLAYRGQDGFFVGEGIHVPWRSGPGGVERLSLDLRAGAYLFDGWATDARLRSPNTFTKVRFDRRPGGSSPELLHQRGDDPGDDGLLVDARGSTDNGELATSWDADVIRGRRGIAATTDLDAAAKPWDRGTIEGVLRRGGFAVSTAVRAVTRRGGSLADVESAGPVTSLRTSGGFGIGDTSSATYDATLEGGALRLSGGALGASAREIPMISPDTLSFARAELGAMLATQAGPILGTLSARGAGDVAAEGRANGSDGAAIGRARAAVPLGRAYGEWTHVLEPFASGAILHARGNALLGSAPGRALAAIAGTAPVVDAGIASRVGRWATRESFDVAIAAGAVIGDDTAPDGSTSNVRPLARGRAGATLTWFGTSIDAAYVSDAGAGPDARGGVVVGRARVGTLDGPRLLANVAVRDGLDPVLARILSDAPLEPPAGYLAIEGTTQGGSLVIPWSRWLTTSAGADADSSRAELVAVRGGFELKDRCGCVTLRTLGSHRIGRTGVDVWLALDFATNR